MMCGGFSLCEELTCLAVDGWHMRKKDDKNGLCNNSRLRVSPTANLRTWHTVAIYMVDMYTDVNIKQKPQRIFSKLNKTNNFSIVEYHEKFSANVVDSCLSNSLFNLGNQSCTYNANTFLALS